MEALVWRVAMSDKDTLSNVWEKWTYTDLLTFVYFQDLDVIHEYNAMQVRNG